MEQARRWERMNLTDGYFWCLPLRGKPGSPSSGYQSRAAQRGGLEAGSKVWVEIDLGESQTIDEIHIVPANPPDLPDGGGYGFPIQFKVVADAGTAGA